MPKKNRDYETEILAALERDGPFLTVLDLLEYLFLQVDEDERLVAAVRAPLRRLIAAGRIVYFQDGDGYEALFLLDPSRMRETFEQFIERIGGTVITPSDLKSRRRSRSTSSRTAG